jgi:type VI secretion system protein ImpL
MSEQWSQLKSYLGLSALVSIYGIASLLVLYAGPSLGLGLSTQIVIIVLLLLTWPFAILISRLARRRRARKEAAESSASTGSSAGSQRAGTSTPNHGDISINTEEAVQWLRNTRLGGRKTGDAVYTLPWFVVAGPPDSGKTSLLLSAGLDFHSLPSQRRSERNVVRPTSSLEYRITDSAVLLDTAGRYQTEDQDGGEWAALFEIVRKHRKTRPIDGLLFAVSAAHVLGRSDSEIEAEAKIMRARLDEAIASARARFPVYLVFTNIDAIEGFDDFFVPFDPSERAQVWGATIALDQADNAHALFDVEFDYLYESLMQRRLVRLSTSADSGEQLKIFNFPLFFGAARSKLGLFTSALFRPNPFSENPLLRGFYFTSSSTAGNGGSGSPGIGKRAALDDDDAGETRIDYEGYFTQRLLGDVLLRDKDLAGSFQAKTQHPHRVRNALLAVAAGLLVIFATGLFVSFAFNKVLIAEAADRGQNVVEIAQRDNGADPSKKGSAESRTELEAVNSLRTLLAKLDDYDRNSPPLYLRFGLYCGNAMNDRVREIYFDSINQRFFKNTGSALERDLQSFVDAAPQSGPHSTEGGASGGSQPQPAAARTPVADDLGGYYDLLKAYLMASSISEKSEWAFLSGQLADYWIKSAPPELENLSRQQLDFYAQQASSPGAPRWAVNDALVTKARTKLQAYPAIDRFYKTITTEINEQVQPITLDSIVPPQGRGWVTGSPSVPGSFTIEGYREHMLKAFNSASGEISKDDWVMGALAKGESTDVNKLQAKYFTEYSAQWRQFLRETRVAKFNSKDDVREALKVMSATNSPVGLVIEKVAEETNLTGASRGGGFFAWIRNLFGSNKSTTGVGGTLVDKEFAPLTQFVSSEDDKAGPGLSQYRNELQSLRDQLEPAAGDQLAQTSHSLLTSKEDALFQKTQQDIGRLLEALSTPASKDAAALLMQPLRNIRAVQTAGTFDQIEQTWRNQIYPKAKALESGYPFTDGGEASVEDLARFLNPVDGELWTFFNTKLTNTFDDVQGRWKLQESGAFNLSPEFVDYLNNARQLRDALFASGSKQPSVAYDLTLQPPATGDLVLDLDGNPPVIARTGSPGSVTLKWPAQVGDVGAKLTVNQGSGPPENKLFPGKWGLFKMVQQGGGSKASGNQYQLSWAVGSASVRATLRPASATSDPFQLSLFRQLHAPQDLKRQ